MKPLEILITNNTLADRAGTELYVRDVAISLKNRGHKPVAYSQILGEVADEIRAAEIPVVDDLKKLTKVPDLIHGHHNLETMTALLHFPNSPGIFYCHGYVPWQEQPPVFPRILRYIAVDHACLDRLHETGIHPNRIRVIYNFADLKRFLPRKPLPPQPRKALVFSNYAHESDYLPVIRKACKRAGIELNVAGIGLGRPCRQPETLLPEYDLVFAKARAAIEALAVGCAVITCDHSGFGSMVTTRNLDAFRPLNFGLRTLTRPMELKVIFEEIACYNPRDAEAVSRRIRTIANMEDAIDQLLVIYQEVITEFEQTKPARETEEEAVAAYLGWLSALVKGTEPRLLNLCDKLQQENKALKVTMGITQDTADRKAKPWKNLKRLWNSI